MLHLAVLPPAVSNWLVAQPQWLLLIVTVVMLAMVIKGADWLVVGAAGMAQKFGMPQVVIGATIVSLGTTSPETAVSVLAAFRGNSGLALGNGVGSIIADTGLIFGLACILATLPADRFILNRQGWVQFAVAAILAVWCYAKWLMVGDQAQLSWLFGVLCLVILAWYLWMSVKWARAHTGMTRAEEIGDEVDIDKAAAHSTLFLLVLGLIGLVLVVFAGSALVESVGELTLRWGVPEVVVAGTLVAIGTSLPELVVAITAIRKGHYGLVVGNVIGADILNVIWVIGLSALGGSIVGNGLPIAADGNPVFLFLHLPVLLVMLTLFRVFVFKAGRSKSFSRWMGVPMLVLYAVYIAMSIFIGQVDVGH